MSQFEGLRRVMVSLGGMYISYKIVNAVYGEYNKSRRDDIMNVSISRPQEVVKHTKTVQELEKQRFTGISQTCNMGDEALQKLKRFMKADGQDTIMENANDLAELLNILTDRNTFKPGSYDCIIQILDNAGLAEVYDHEKVRKHIEELEQEVGEILKVYEEYNKSRRDPIMNVPLPRPQEVVKHTTTVQELEKQRFTGISKICNLGEEALQKLKRFMKADGQDTMMENVNDLAELLTILRDRNKFKPGSYDCIIQILDNAGLAEGYDHEKVRKHIEDFEQDIGDILKDFEFDVLLLHTDEDLEDARIFRDHLINGCRIEDLKVVLYDEIGIGQSNLRAIENVFAKTRYIFVYVTQNLKVDDLTRMIHEMALMESFSNPVKKWRIVPIQTTEKKCDILQLKVIKGLNYWNFLKSQIYEDQYIKTVQELVHRGRRDITVIE